MGIAYHLSRVAGSLGTLTDSGAGAACTSPLGLSGSICNRLLMAGAKYQQGPWRLFISWAQARQPLAKDGGARVLFAPVAGGAYTAGGLNNSKTDTYDMGANYTLLPNWLLLTSVQRSEVSFVNAPKGTVKQLNLGLDHPFSVRTDSYILLARQGTKTMYAPGASVQANGSVPGNDNSQSLISIGMRHKF